VSAPARVLVVDDAKAARDILTRRLEQDGHWAEVAEDGEQALMMLKAADYDLVLLDILMPGLDGYGVHLMLTPVHAPIVDDDLADLAASVATVRAGAGTPSRTPVVY
jgi:two-component system, OmpR family, response regulator RpaB